MQAPKNPQNLNRYSYVANNPTNLVDPSGYFFGIDDLFLVAYIVIFAAGAAATGAAVGAVVGGVVAAITGRPIGPAIANGALYGAVGGAAGFVGGITGGMLAESVAETLGASQAVISAVSDYAFGVGGGAAAGTATAAVGGEDVGQGAVWGAGTAAVLNNPITHTIEKLIGRTIGAGNEKTALEARILEKHPELRPDIEQAFANKGQWVDLTQDWLHNPKFADIQQDLRQLQALDERRRWMGPLRMVFPSYLRTHGEHTPVNEQIRYDRIHFHFDGGVPRVHVDRASNVRCLPCHGAEFIGDEIGKIF